MHLNTQCHIPEDRDHTTYNLIDKTVDKTKPTDDEILYVTVPHPFMCAIQAISHISLTPSPV